jgi:DNA repair protein RadA/Sms
LIGGNPGIGKSTLLLEVCGRLAKLNYKLLYVSGEESSGQIASRCKRLGITSDNLLILHQNNLEEIKKEINSSKPTFLVIDSIQTTHSDLIQSPPGTMSQIREVTYEIMNLSKAKNITTFIIGHVTKEGSIAGPKLLEHMVDTVIYFEGDQLGHYRMLRVNKNRFGNTNEVGIFEMSEEGLKEITNPSKFFLEDHLENSFGKSLTCIYEGSRPLLLEIQALTVDGGLGNARRTTQGLDGNRLAMLVAIVEKYFGIVLVDKDIYVNVVGGIKLQGREADLAIIASILSSLKRRPIEEETIFIGEVGLTGEVRSVPFVESRIRELQQLGYKKVITSFSSAEKLKAKYKIAVIGIKKASELEGVVF